MRTSYRALNVESVEDRSLPSSYIGFAAPSAAHFTPTNYYQPYVTFATATWEAHEVTAEGRIVNVRFFEPVMVIHEPYWYGRTEGFNGSQPTQPTPVVVGVNDGGNADSGTSAVVGSGTGPRIAEPQVVSHGQNAAPANVSIPVPTESTNVAAPVQVAQAAAAAVQAAAIQATQMQVVTTAPISVGRVGGYTNTAIIGPADAAAVPPPPSSAEPPLAPAPTPPADDSETPAAPATSDPVAGLLPVDLSTLQATASQLLGRVADLAPAWPDGMPSLSNSLWMAAIGVLGGGAIYAATNRPARPSRDAFGSASALSEWERRNARSAG